MLKEARFDTTYPTDVKDSLCEEIRGERDTDILEGSREALTLARESPRLLPKREE